MGDAADMMLDGTLCQGCGTLLGNGPSGFPRSCRECRKHPASAAPKPQPLNRKRKKSSNIGLMVGVDGVQVVNPKELETLPLGTFIYCTPHDLRIIADKLQAGGSLDDVRPCLTSLLTGKAVPA